MTIQPMLATEMPIDTLTDDQWAWEGKHDGVRIIARNDSGAWHLQTRSGRTVTSEYKLALPDMPPVILDGEAVVLDSGVPSFNAIQNKAVASRVDFYAFDVLQVDGTSMLDRPYEVRRKVLEVLRDSCGLVVPPLVEGRTGADAMAWAEAQRYEGIVAKRLGSPYHLGKRSKMWLKSKVWRTADVVLGGWKEGNGRRGGGVGNIMMGFRTPQGLRFCGRVGTGFTDAELDRLGEIFTILASDNNPFVDLPQNQTRGAHWIRPLLTAEVRYQVQTGAGHLRHPSWRGIKEWGEHSNGVDAARLLLP